jgi:hypothetical protein
MEGEASAHRVADVGRRPRGGGDEQVAALVEAGVGVPGGRAVPGRVDGDGAVAVLDEAGEERRPAPSGLGEAVDEHHRVAAGRSVLVGVERHGG